MIDVELVTRSEELEEEWRALVMRVEAWPCQTPGWNHAWWRAFGEGRWGVLTAREDGALAATLPLVRAGGRLRSPTNWHSSLYGCVAASLDAADALARRLLEERPRRIDLEFLSPADPILLPLRDALRAAGYRWSEEVMQRSPFVRLSGGWDDYEAVWLAGDRGRELRRRRRRLEEDAGPVRLDVWESGGGLDALLDEGFSVEGSGWKDERGTAIRSEPVTSEFYRSVARWAEGRGWLRLAFLRSGERAVAFDLALEMHGRHFLVKTGYDPAFRRHAPGSLLRIRMLRRAFDLGLRSYEFLGDDDAWKLRWTDRVRPRLRLRAHAPGPAGTADLATHRARNLAKWAIRRAGLG